MLSSTINLVRSSTYKAIKSVLTFANLTPFPGGYRTKPVITTFQIQIFNRNDGISFAKARLLVFLLKVTSLVISVLAEFYRFQPFDPRGKGKQNNSNSVRRNSIQAILERIKHSHIKLCITLQRWFSKLQNRFVEPL